MVRLPFGPRRADKEGEKAKPTEVVLTNSRWTGEPIRINTNRTYLQRAMKLGLNDLCLYGEKLLCSAKGSIASSSGCRWSRLRHRARGRCHPHRIATRRNRCSYSPTRNPKESSLNERTDNQHDRQGRKQRPGQDRQPRTRKASRRKASQQDIAALIDQAVKFRTALHDLCSSPAAW